MSSATAAECWGIKQNTVTRYCKQGKLFDCFKDGSNNWYISIDEIKPLKDTDIKNLLILTLKLKNNPAHIIDWSTFDFDDNVIDKVYRHLAKGKYIKEFNCSDKKRIPYEVVLTEKGLNKVFSKSNAENADISKTIQQWLPVLIGVGKGFVELSVFISKMQ